MANNKLPKELQKQINKQLKKAKREIGMKLLEDTRKMYLNAIDRFYSDYIPVMYKRTGASKRAINISNKNSFYKYINILPDGVRVTFSIDPSYIHGSPYHDIYGNTVDKEFIFDRTFRLGAHGYGMHDHTIFNNWYAKMTFPTPKTSFEEDFYKYKRNVYNLADLARKCIKSI